jgi:nucleoside-diphosphate-sugar epimerase
MRETIIITGISGFIGANLKSYLKDSFTIKGVSRKANKKDDIYEYKDVPELLNKSKACVHSAGKAHDLKQTSEDAEYFKINTELTKMIFDQFLKSECKIFIYLSSVKAVRDTVNEVLTEDATTDPKTVYGRSKLKAEEYITNQTLPEGKSYFILRPCMVHGPGNKGNLNLLYNFVSKGFPYPLSSFENKRSYLSVENLCFIISELIQRKDIPSGIYNVSDDDALSTTELISILSKAINKPPRLLPIPKKIIYFIAKIGDILKLPIDTEKLGKLTENYIVSNQKIKQALKKSLPLSAREGILKTASAFKND